MSNLPQDFLSEPNSGTTVTRIDFADTDLPEYAPFYAVLLDNVLTPSECQTLVQAAEAQGDWERAMIQVGQGRQERADDVRKCGRIIWDSQEVVAKLWTRVGEHIPEIARLKGQPKVTGGGAAMRGEIWKLSRLNERMRFLKYQGGEYFRVHEDGMYQRPDGSERSYFTLHLYLNGTGEKAQPVEGRDEELEGGATTFHSSNMKRRYDVLPKAGRVLIFQHRGLWHSGDDVVRGVKYTMRTDIMYSMEKRVE